MNTQQKLVLALTALLMAATVTVAPFRLLKAPERAGAAPVEIDTSFRPVWHPKRDSDAADFYEIDRERIALQGLGIVIMAALTMAACAHPAQTTR